MTTTRVYEGEFDQEHLSSITISGLKHTKFSALVCSLGDITFIDRFQLNLKIFLSLAPTCILNIAILLKFRGSHECITS